MSEVDTVNGVAIADIESINDIAAADIETLDGVDFVTGFSNTYSVRSNAAGTRGGYVNIADPSKYHMVDGAQAAANDESFSVSLWAKADTWTWFPFFAKGSTTDREYYAVLQGTTYIYWVLSSNATATNLIYRSYNTSGLSTGTWYNIVFIYEAGITSGAGAVDGLKIAVNGSVVTTGTWSSGYTGMRDSGDNLEFLRFNGNSNLADGWIDEVGFWAKALSNDDLTEIYNSGAPADLSTHSAANDLLSWWRMGDSDGGSGTALTDVIGSEADPTYGEGTLSGTPAVYIADVP